MRHKSFYVLMCLSILFILAIRGCYEGKYIINGRTVDNALVAWHVSKFVFHMISAGILLMVAMLSMKIFSRDQEDGSVVMFLSRSVFRWEYVIGRIAGTWALCTVFMFLLHLVILIIMRTETGTIFYEYMVASLVCSINLLFVIVCVCFLSL
ncbi:MAG: hypothetical protein JW882_10560, partial [Deltaproteobacteria bacterium]|nr:hypothetical protein [Deltaproteobacteria bacterium]